MVALVLYGCLGVVWLPRQSGLADFDLCSDVTPLYRRTRIPCEITDGKCGSVRKWLDSRHICNKGAGANLLRMSCWFLLLVLGRGVLGGVCWEGCVGRGVLGGVCWEGCVGRGVLGGVCWEGCVGRGVLGGVCWEGCAGRGVLGGVCWIFFLF